LRKTVARALQRGCYRIHNKKIELLPLRGSTDITGSLSKGEKTMLSYTTYKLVHLVGIFVLLSGVAGLWTLELFSDSAGYAKARKGLMAMHGIAIFVVLFGAFGTLARLGIDFPWPPWIWLKIGIWVVLGGLPALLSRSSGASKVLFLIAPLLAAVAAWAAINQVGG
jgi:hypothetical protein